MSRHGLHHALWPTERRALPSQQRKAAGHTIGLTACGQGFDRRETMLIRQPQKLLHRQRWLARTTPKPCPP
jgi:hypothetical protein